MNYYEELGVSPQATEQEIRKAHRRLVKLMHPDAQPDQALKMLAETQMRRLNSIVSTLVDPEQRRLYDDELRAEESPAHAGGGMPSWQGIPWWLASAVGAVALTLIAVWLWADHLGTAFGNKSKTVVVENRRPELMNPGPSEDGASVGASYTPPVPSSVSPNQPVSPHQKDNGSISARVISDPPPAVKPEPKIEQAKVEQPKVEQVRTPPVKQAVVRPDPPAIVSNKTPASVPKLVPAPTKTTETKKQVSERKTAMSTPVTQAAQQFAPAAKKIFSMPADSLIARATSPRTAGSSQLPVPPGVNAAAGRDYGSSSLLPSSLPTPAPPPASAPDVVTSASAGNRDPLEGEWVYAPKEPERKRSGFYPPEFIDLKLTGTGDPGNLRGQYNAKYAVSDRPVSPIVNFELASVSKGSRKFVWQSNDGAKGTLSIDPIDEHTIRVDWHTTSGTHGPALTSGQATLVRRQ